MKKILGIILSLVLIFGALAACAPADLPDPEFSADNTVIRIAGMTGPTGMGLAKLLADDEKGLGNDYEFTLAGSADVIAPMVINKELDIAAVPANLASVLYNKTQGGVKVLAVNTLGVLYIVNTDGSIASLEDLKGKTVYATGQGAAPEYALRYVLTQNGIDPDADLTIEWKTEPAEVVGLMANGTASVAMLPQPYVTVAQGKVEGLSVALDITEEWNKIGGDGMCLTGVVIATTEFIEQNPDAVDRFLIEYRDSINYANTNVAEAAELIGQFEIVDAKVAAKALPYCNLKFIGGEEMKEAVEGYLSVLFEQNSKAIGGNMPGEDFYYTELPLSND